jgi:hypothetical protein
MAHFSAAKRRPGGAWPSRLCRRRDTEEGQSVVQGSVHMGGPIVLAWPKLQCEAALSYSKVGMQWRPCRANGSAAARRPYPLMHERRAWVRSSMRLRRECFSRSRRPRSPLSRFVKFGRGIVFACPIFQRRRCCRCRGIRLRHLYQSRQMTTGAPCNAYFSA